MVVIEEAEEWEDDEKQPKLDQEDILKIPGSVVSFVERLDDELTRSLQHTDPHTSEYVERLTDDASLYINIVRTLLYAERIRKDPKVLSSQDVVNRVVMRRLENIYFKVIIRHGICQLLKKANCPLPAVPASYEAGGKYLESDARGTKFRHHFAGEDVRTI